MDYLSKIHLFLEVAKQKSFVNAAKKFGMTGPALSKQIQALEERLGVKLFHRTTRQVTLTEAGLVYCEKAKKAIEDLTEAEHEIQDTRSIPKGFLKLNMPSSFGKRYLTKPLAAFAKEYPEIKIEVNFDDKNIDIVKEGYDLVVRIGALEDSSLIAKKIASCPIVLCASPDYLEEYGVPKRLEDLPNHPAIIYNNHSNSAEWKCQDLEGNVKSMVFSRHFTSDNAEMMLEACLAGVGISLLPIFSAVTHLKSGQLIAIFPEHKIIPERNICIIFPQNRYLSTKIRLLTQWLIDASKALPWE